MGGSCTYRGHSNRGSVNDFQEGCVCSIDTPRADQHLNDKGLGSGCNADLSHGGMLFIPERQSRKATGVPTLFRTMCSLKHVTGVRIFPMNIFVTETAEHGTVSRGRAPMWPIFLI